eukprot:COSAG01_NODE_170_length_23136_cov_24.853931_16_plen_95_part_00
MAELDRRQRALAEGAAAWRGRAEEAERRQVAAAGGVSSGEANARLRQVSQSVRQQRAAKRGSVDPLVFVALLPCPPGSLGATCMCVLPAPLSIL